MRVCVLLIEDEEEVGLLLPLRKPRRDEKDILARFVQLGRETCNTFAPCFVRKGVRMRLDMYR